MNYLKFDSRVLIVLTSGLLALSLNTPLAAQVPDRSGPPELGPAPTLEMPPVQRFTLSSGLPVVLLEKHSVPLVQINLQVRAGSWHDPAGKPGIADLTADMLDEGVAGMTAMELADAVDYLGVTLTTGVGKHTSKVAINSPLIKLEAGLGLMADVVLRPSFPDDELDRKRKMRLTELMQQHDQPGTIAQAMLDQILFGADHPYGRQDMGDEASLKATARKDLARFHKTYYRPNNATLIVAGDVTVQQIRPMLEKAFGKWKKRRIKDRTYP